MNTSVKTGLRLLALACAATATLLAQQTAPAPTPRVIPGYVIGPNDVITLNVYSGNNLQMEFRASNYTVQIDGSVQLPLVPKKVVIGGKSVDEANAVVRQALLDAKAFTEVRVDIIIAEYKSSQIKVQGAVRSGGTIMLKADRMNISDALSAAGGITQQAGTEIRVRRSGGRAAEPDVLVRDGWEIYSKEDLNQGRLVDVQLFSDDIIDVPVAPNFYVNGFVTTPGQYQWEPNLTLERALLKAGGASKDGAANRVEVRRMNPKTKTTEKIKLAKDKMSTLIEAEDIIFVPKKRM
jgi:polysaccharide export outer membrane protein